MEETSPYAFVTALEKRIAAAETEFHAAYWDSQVDASPANDERRAALEIALREIKGDPSALAAVRDSLAGDLHDPVLVRTLEVLRLSLTGNQMDEGIRREMVGLSSEVESEFATYRPTLHGKPATDNEIEEILRASDDDAERRRAWEASKEIGARVAARVRELARLRNRAAHDLGYADYFSMSLDLQELPEEWLDGLLDELEIATSGPFRRWKNDLDERLAARFGVDEIRPWHYADPFFQQLPPDGAPVLDDDLRKIDPLEAGGATFADWGIDVSEVLARSDLYSRARKSQHAFCIDIDRSGRDVRVLANVVAGEKWTEVVLHELGHAAYDISIDSHLPYTLRRAAHTFVTEAIALLCGALVRDPQWLARYGGVASARALELAPSLEAASAAHRLLMTRWILVVTRFERALYADPEADLDSVWWDLVERFQMVARPPGRSHADWAAKIHVAAAPVYYQNYLLGDVLAAQLRSAIARSVGPLVANRETGLFLAARLFRHGSLLRWDALVEGATGYPLAAGAFIGELAAAVPATAT